MNDTAEEGAIRLMGGATPTEGRVEIFLFGHWGTICDSGWDSVDATVVCHQLGYLGAVGAPRSAAFGAGNGPSWYSGVNCAGNEHKLTECSHSEISGSACLHSRDAGVICSSEIKGSRVLHIHTVAYFPYIIMHTSKVTPCMPSQFFAIYLSVMSFIRRILNNS